MNERRPSNEKYAINEFSTTTARLISAAAEYSRGTVPGSSLSEMLDQPDAIGEKLKYNKTNATGAMHLLFAELGVYDDKPPTNTDSEDYLILCDVAAKLFTEIIGETPLDQECLDAVSGNKTLSNKITIRSVLSSNHLELLDNKLFERLIQRGVDQNNLRQYEPALRSAILAYMLAGSRSVRQGRAARDMSFRLARLGRADIAKDWAKNALQIHTLSVKNQPTHENMRELAASELAIADIELHEYLNSHTQSVYYDISDGQKAANNAMEMLLEAETNSIDQYRINLESRASALDTLLAKQLATNDREKSKELFKSGRKMAFTAIKHSFASESPSTYGVSKNIPKKARTVAKAKAFVRGTSALGANILLRSNSKRLGNFAINKLIRLIA